LKHALVIFDFDGVVADTEIVSNTVLAEALTELGLPTTLEEALATYMGRSWTDCARIAEEKLGRPLPADFGKTREERLFARLAVELEAVAGAIEFIEATGDRRRCIASSSTREWLFFCLDRLNLRAHFGDHVFSATEVPRGKPHPDLFLHAAKTLGVDPAATLVLEDSVLGVRAGVAAGMTTIGLCAGKHIRPGHADKLREAGAHRVVASFAELK
jgi:HAD superfamily hydrolase (TIGR01509 family)